LGEQQGITPIEATARGEVDILDAGIDEAQLGRRKPIGQAPVGTHSSFAIQHQAQPFIAAEIAGARRTPMGGYTHHSLPPRRVRSRGLFL